MSFAEQATKIWGVWYFCDLHAARVRSKKVWCVCRLEEVVDEGQTPVYWSVIKTLGVLLKEDLHRERSYGRND